MFFDTYVFSRRGALGSGELELWGEVVDERFGFLMASEGEGLEDFPGLLAEDGAIAAGEFAGDDGGAQGTLGTIVGRLDVRVMKAGQQVVPFALQTLLDCFVSRPAQLASYISSHCLSRSARRDSNSGGGSCGRSFQSAMTRRKNSTQASRYKWNRDSCRSRARWIACR